MAMFSRVAVTAALLTMLCVGSAEAQQTATSLWPNQQDNEWTFEVTSSQGSNQQVEMRIAGRSGGWAQLEGFEGTNWFWMSTSSGKMWVWDWNANTYFPVADLGGAEGSTFTMQFPAAACLNQSRWQVVDMAATVATPVGTFNDCVIVENIQPVCADAGIERMVFAPGIGPVEYGWTTLMGAHTARLVHAIVDGTEYTRVVQASGGLTVCLTLDKVVYTAWNNLMPPVPAGGRPLNPDTMDLTLSVRNDSSDILMFRHTSSQEYDVVIRDAQGNVFYTWSANKSFMQMINNKTLGPGQTLEYNLQLELRDHSGVAFPAGHYTVEFIHTTDHSKGRNSATAGFEIEVQNVY